MQRREPSPGPRGVSNGRRGFSPEHVNAEPPYRTRRAGYGGRADKYGPNRSPLIAIARHGIPDVVAICDVGVFRHAATERGGGGGLWTDEENVSYNDIALFRSSSIPSRTIGPH